MHSKGRIRKDGLPNLYSYRPNNLKVSGRKFNKSNVGMKIKISFESQGIPDTFCKLGIEVLAYCITCALILFVWRMRGVPEAVADASA